MNNDERRKKINKILTDADAPISASALAKKFSVSRQVIVGDVAILRAEGSEILATPKGYITGSAGAGDFPYIGIVACKHDLKGLKDELNIIVDEGGTAIDVMIDHAIYGELLGILNVSTRPDVDKFIDTVKREGAQPLSSLTGGIHMHHIGCASKSHFDRIREKLDDAGITL